VADQKPPRRNADERETLCTALQFQRESLVRKVDGVSEADARRELVGSGMTLLWMMKHMSRAERIWVLDRFADVERAPDDTVTDGDTLLAMVAAYEQTWRVVDDVMSSHSLDDVAAINDGLPPVNLRWIVTHLLEETARHAGHADILREQLDGSTGR
jgi:uncharacterized damage-inducible protein DinB